MINVTIIAVGKLKESYLRDGCLEYIKRMGAYAKTQIIEINEEKCPDNPSENQIKAVIQKEGERILKDTCRCGSFSPVHRGQGIFQQRLFITD